MPPPVAGSWTSWPRRSKRRVRDFEDVTVAVQGFGNVGSNAALLIAEQGAKIIAVADHTGRRLE